MSLRSISLWILVAALWSGCAGTSWEHVRSQDTIAAYRRYLAEHPKSAHSAEAQERIAVLQFEREPSLAALERFQKEHPGSPALAQLAARAEATVFEQARAQADAEGYEQFLQVFPDGELSRRAAGNLAYLSAGGFADRVGDLAAFVAAHPDSDYAAEARRSLAAVEQRRSDGFAVVGLQIEIAPDVSEAERLRAVFAERARAIYQDAGIRLTDGPAAATVVIRHAERHVGAASGGELLAKPGVLAETQIELVRSGSQEPEFRDVLTWRVADSDVRGGGSALFAKTSAPFWDSFYVPIATWPNASAKRATVSELGAVAGMGAELGRMIAIAPDGGFRDLDLSDPSSPRLVGRYVRSGAPARFSGARVLGDRVVLFGEDGVEIAGRGAASYARIAAYDRGAVGAVAGVEIGADGSLLLAGTKGLLRASLDGGSAERLVEHPLRGIARSGDTLFVLDDRWLYSAPIADLQPTRFFTALELGRALDAHGVAVRGGLGVVFGGGGAVTFVASRPGPAQVLARSRTATVGDVTDAAVLGGAVFLLSDRGLLALDPRTGRIMDSLDVDGRLALGAAGNHLVAMGRDRLDVVDAAPWLAHGAPAALAP